MIDRSVEESATKNQSDKPVRKPWHAPQFIATGLAETDTQGNGGTDHGPMNSAS